MDLRGLLGLNDPMGLLFCLAGLAAQLWFSRKNKWLLAANAIAVFVLLILFEALKEFWFPRFSRFYGRSVAEWTTALIQLWCLSLCAVWAGLQIRNRIPVFNKERRALFAASTAAICATPAAVFAFGILARKDTVVREVAIKFRGLPRDLQNVRLVQISDIHLSAFYLPKDFARVIDQANELNGDLGIMTGDLITAFHDPLDIGLRQLARLKNTAGLWACMGNHEHFAGVEDRAAQLGLQYGIKFLRTEARGLKFGQHTINLVGVDYQSTHFPYLPGVEELVESDQFNILLSHNPDVFPVAVNKGFDLVLSGHTHGGQVNVEIFDHNLNVADFATPYTKGLYTKNNSAIYVNSGIGTIGMPVRLGAPPEITLITLCAAETVVAHDGINRLCAS